MYLEKNVDQQKDVLKVLLCLSARQLASEYDTDNFTSRIIVWLQSTRPLLSKAMIFTTKSHKNTL